MTNRYTIKEYEYFYCDKDNSNQIKYGCKPLSEKTFDDLEQFVLSNKSTNDIDTLELMSLSAKRGIGKTIGAKNYVGVIAMKDGTTIEILPKVYSGQVDNIESTKKLFLDMLKSLRNSPYKSIQTTNVHFGKMHIFEIFIRMFLDEVFIIVKRGLKCSYVTETSNESFYKGKIQFSEHIKSNYTHKERAYVEYDNFSCNRPENKLIKSTLVFLRKISISSRNKSDINILLSSFDDVDCSINYEQDFSQYVNNRNMKEYDTAIKWSKVFLINKSFTSFAGSEVAYALLFPMEVLFENYIAKQLSKTLNKNEYKVAVQDKLYHLFDYPNKKFLIKPDIVVTSKLDNTCFVLDTKWKVLSESKNNYGISQADMYQMYAYQKKYKSVEVILVYPMSDIFEKCIEYISNDGVTVKIMFVDFSNVRISINSMIEHIKGNDLSFKQT